MDEDEEDEEEKKPSPIRPDFESSNESKSDSDLPINQESKKKNNRKRRHSYSFSNSSQSKTSKRRRLSPPSTSIQNDGSNPNNAIAVLSSSESVSDPEYAFDFDTIGQTTTKRMSPPSNRGHRYPATKETRRRGQGRGSPPSERKRSRSSSHGRNRSSRSRSGPGRRRRSHQNNDDDEKKEDEEEKLSEKQINAYLKEWSDINGMKPEILKVIKTKIENGQLKGPSDYQKQSLQAILSGDQFIGEEVPRNGKTTAMALEFLNSIKCATKEQGTPGANSELNDLQGLHVAPEREAPLKMRKTLLEYGVNLQLSVATIIGQSQTVESNVRSIKNGQHILCATPGRLADLIRNHSDKLPNGQNWLKNVTFLGMEDYDILKEDNGENSFREDMETIFGALDEDKVIFHAVASMAPDDIRERLQQQMQKMNYERNVEEHHNLPSSDYIPGYIEIRVIYCKGEVDKYENLIQILTDAPSERKVLVYANTNDCVGNLYKQIFAKKDELGTNAVFQYGAKVIDQKQRERLSEMINNKDATSFIVFSTNLLSRNEDCVFDLVIHYDMAWTANEFIQRSSRLINKKQEPRYNIIFALKVRGYSKDEALLNEIENDYGIRKINETTAGHVKDYFV